MTLRHRFTALMYTTFSADLEHGSALMCSSWCIPSESKFLCSRFEVNFAFTDVAVDDELRSQRRAGESKMANIERR